MNASAVHAVCARLVEAGQHVRRLGWRDVVERLGSVGERFTDPSDPLRLDALARLPEEAALTPPMARVVLDGMARDWTRDRIHSMLRAELEQPDCLDGVCPVGGRRLAAVGPSLCVQIVSGSVPGVGVHALIRSLVLKAPTLLKPGKGDVVLPELFARGLAEEAPDLAQALEVFYWKGGDPDPERVALHAAEVVVVYGSDETVRSVRAATPGATRVVGYHHRVGVAVIGRHVLGPDSIGRCARELAEAVSLFEQRGCVCPHLVWVEGGPDEASGLADELAEALAELERRLPSFPPTPEERAALQQLRGTAELTALAEGGSVRHGDGAPWTVIVEAEPAGGGRSLQEALPTFARGVRVMAIPDAAELTQVLAPLGRHLQTVGYAGLGGRLEAVAGGLARAGASRIVPLKRMSFPPPWWLHDGRGPIRDLLRWAEVEEA